ncbi:hypothetical protein [Blastococcus colisei]|uniref:hypothetical protein n=1 Tax=Blastococcus colisei TaxID=1564162 RepID=UPI001477012D|nr:hypothetical protein [Blastococcus colisei]
MNHAPRTAAAAEDDAVGVAVNSVQHLGVTDHERSFRLPEVIGKHTEGEHRATTGSG